VLTFDDRSIAPQHLFEVFHDTTAPLFDTAPMSDGASCRCAATDYLVDDLVVSKLSYDAQTFRRRRAHVRDGASDWITLQVYRRGGIRGSIGDGREIAIDASNVGVVDLSLPFAVYSEPSEVIWVGFPRDRLERADELAALGEAPTWSLDSTRGRALVASATDLWERLGAARPEDAGDLAGEITDTVNRVLRPGHFAPTDHGRRLAIKEFIAANLDDLISTSTPCGPRSTTRDRRSTDCSTARAASPATSASSGCCDVSTNSPSPAARLAFVRWRPAGASTIPATSTVCSRGDSGWPLRTWPPPAGPAPLGSGWTIPYSIR
jgi:hypothetical protein